MSKKRNKPHRHVHRLHRWFGIIAAVFALNLAITGIALNHTESLNLDSTLLHSPFLLKWYGIEASAPELAFAIGDGWLIQRGEELFLNTQLLPFTATEVLQGAVLRGAVIVALFPDRVALFLLSAELVDVISLPEGHRADGIADGHDGEVLLKTDQAVLALDASLSKFTESKLDQALGWRQPQELPAELLATMERNSGGSISLERIILDLHSGRLFGTMGVWVMDLAAIAIAALSISGVFMWVRRAKRTKRRGQDRRVETE